MALAFFFLSGLFLVLALHPFTTYPLSLYFLRRISARPIAPARLREETIAVCVCAYNEAAVIEEKAKNLIALKRACPNLNVLVYVDGASDGTAEILKRYAAEIELYISPERHGKTHGMNLLVSQAKTSLVVFTDANVMLDAEAINKLPYYFSDPLVGCVCGYLQYSNAAESITAKTGSLYWRLEERIKQMESDTGSLMGADGSIFAIRRALHRPPPDDIIDDMFVSFSILCDGYRLVRAPDIRASEKSVTSSREEFSRKVRIACQAFNVHRLLWKRLRHLSGLDLYKYISHKFLRWLVAVWLAFAAFYFEAGMIVCGFGRTGLAMALCASIVFVGTILARLPRALQIANILSAFVATGLGVLHSLSGSRYKTWSPAQSIRGGH